MLCKPRTSEKVFSWGYQFGKLNTPTHLLLTIEPPILGRLSLCSPYKKLLILLPNLESLELMAHPKLSVQTPTEGWLRITRLRSAGFGIGSDDFSRTLLQLPELSGLDIRQLFQNNNRSTKPLLMLNYSLGSPLIINLITPNLLTLLITNNAYVGVDLTVPCDSQIIAGPMLLYYLSQFI